MTLIRVNFSKQVNDANYGWETARVEFEVVPDDEASEEVDETATPVLLARARAYVHAELSKSPNAAVRRALETQSTARPVPASVTVPDDDDTDEDLPY
jgi:hypothetical protein